MLDLEQSFTSAPSWETYRRLWTLQGSELSIHFPKTVGAAGCNVWLVKSEFWYDMIWMILTDVSDTIHADSLASFALNIEILLADVTKPEKSKILTLTWPVTSSVTSGSNFWPCTGSSRTGLSNGVWNLEIGPVVWEISGGALRPPQQDVLLTRPQRGEG